MVMPIGSGVSGDIRFLSFRGRVVLLHRLRACFGGFPSLQGERWPGYHQ